MNKVILEGTVTNEPRYTIRLSENGFFDAATFEITVGTKYNNDGIDYEIIPCFILNKQGKDFMNCTKKGDRLIIYGYLETRISSVEEREDCYLPYDITLVVYKYINVTNNTLNIYNKQ